jgi:hypothetical protein
MIPQTVPFTISDERLESRGESDIVREAAPRRR